VGKPSNNVSPVPQLEVGSRGAQQTNTMTDITKCTGEGCPLKETCYRFTAPAEMYQSYFMAPPVKNGKCEYHWSQNATSNQSLHFLQQLKPKP
jgi:hypothetical protein